MSESARKKRRTSLRTADGSDEVADTPRSNLRQLAGIIPKPATPRPRASSAGPGPTPGSRRTPNILIRTPGTAARTPRGGPATRPISARKHAPTTPHALRALRERANAGRTPGQVRRRSGRVQRETPRDTLRALSKALVQKGGPRDTPIEVAESAPRNPLADLPDLEDGPDPVAPRLSMALDDMYEDDSFQDAPPRRSLLPELPDDVDTGTIHSLEFGRRALSEDPRSRLSGRVSDRFADLRELGIAEEEFEIDGTFINRTGRLDPDQLLGDAIDEVLENTSELGDRRQSELDLGVFGEVDEQDEPTFHFDIPRRIRAPAEEELPDAEEEYASADDGQDVGAVGNETPGLALDEDAPEVEAPGWELEQGDDNDVDLEAYREEESAIDRSLLTQTPEAQSKAAQKTRRSRRELKISRFGHEYPSIPQAVVKRLATGLARSQGGKTKITADTLAVLVQASDWFFEQVGEDLAAYANHAGRKMIENADMIALMKRQRQVTDNATAFSLAQKMLPRELLQELRMEPPKKLKGRKRKQMATIDEGNEDG